MPRKYPGNDFKKRWVFSRRKNDNNFNNSIHAVDKENCANLPGLFVAQKVISGSYMISLYKEWNQYAYVLFPVLYALLGGPLAAAGLVCSYFRRQCKPKTKTDLHKQFLLQFLQVTVHVNIVCRQPVGH